MFLESIVRVFRKPRYVLLGCIGVLIAFTITSYSIQPGLISSLISVGSWGAVFRVLWSGIYAVGGDVGIVIAGILSLLWGVYSALAVYYIRHAHVLRVMFSSGWGGVVGLLASIFSTGCWACGGVFLAPLIALFGGSISITAVYIGGTVITFIGMSALLWSLYTLTTAIARIPGTLDPDHQVRHTAETYTE